MALVLLLFLLAPSLRSSRIHEQLAFVIPGNIVLTNKADVSAALQKSCDPFQTHAIGKQPTTNSTSTLSCNNHFAIGGNLKIAGSILTDADVAPFFNRLNGVYKSMIVTETTKITSLASLTQLNFVGLAVKLRRNKALRSACGLAGLTGSCAASLRIDVYGNTNAVYFPQQVDSCQGNRKNASVRVADDCIKGIGNSMGEGIAMKGATNVRNRRVRSATYLLHTLPSFFMFRFSL